MKKLMISVAALALMSAPAFAQAADFSTADANGDGQVTYEEAVAVLPDLTEDQFKAADTDSNGTLSEAEYDALIGQSSN